jgi:hypothetical protein
MTKKLLLWVLFPAAVYVAAQWALLRCEAGNPELKVLAPEILHILHFAVLAGMTAILALQVVPEIFKEDIAPIIAQAIKADLVPKMDGYVERLAVAVETSLKDGGITIRPSIIDRGDVEKILVGAMDKQLIADFTDDKSGDLTLRRADGALAAGRVQDCIEILAPVAQKSPLYARRLLAALLMLPTPANLEKAEAMVGQYGEPSHFQKLAYQRWKEGNLQRAISLGERGLQLAEQQSLPSSALRNSLAYYYADANVKTKADRALQYAQAEVDARVAKDGNSVFYAAALDTLGFVRIRFSTTASGVKEGMAECSAAYQAGGTPDDLYFKHLTLARTRLKELTTAPPTGPGPGPKATPVPVSAAAVSLVHPVHPTPSAGLPASDADSSGHMMPGDRELP